MPLRCVLDDEAVAPGEGRRLDFGAVRFNQHRTD
jgi:hypothetical protein